MLRKAATKLASGELTAPISIGKDELEATLSADVLAKPGNYVVTVRAEGEPMGESHRAHLVVGFAENKVTP